MFDSLAKLKINFTLKTIKFRFQKSLFVAQELRAAWNQVLNNFWSLDKHENGVISIKQNQYLISSVINELPFGVESKINIF